MKYSWNAEDTIADLELLRDERVMWIEESDEELAKLEEKLLEVKREIEEEWNKNNEYQADLDKIQDDLDYLTKKVDYVQHQEQKGWERINEKRLREMEGEPFDHDQGLRANWEQEERMIALEEGLGGEVENDKQI